MHDERKIYPVDVPITDYESFGFAEKCPDIIYIHNSYDNNNYVASVYPAFYSDKLVYVSYLRAMWIWTMRIQLKDWRIL